MSLTVIKQHLIRHVGKYLIGALGLGGMAGGVVAPPVVESVKEASANHEHHHYVTWAEFEALNEKLNILVNAGMVDLPNLPELPSIVPLNITPNFSVNSCPEELVKSYCSGN